MKNYEGMHGSLRQSIEAQINQRHEPDIQAKLPDLMRTARNLLPEEYAT